MASTTARNSLAATLAASWRRWLDFDTPPGATWQRLAWTAVWAAGFAALFTLIGFVINAHTVADWLDLHTWSLWFGRNFVVAAVISYLIQGLYRLAFVLFGTGWIAQAQGWRRAAFFSGIPMLGTAIGWPIGMTLVFGHRLLFAAITPAAVISLVVVSTLMSSLVYLYFSLRYKEFTARTRANEARLRLLQGQMEPHFLFNTLATVISLVDTDPTRAKHVLEALTGYLRASLGGLRDDASTLGRELDLATRYLELMRSRMGERLRYEIAVDAPLRDAALAPLLLQPLIENAVKHGLEPQVDGGTVRVAAQRVQENGRALLRICVDDDGIGLAAAARRAPRRVAGGPDGHGIALANLRERLQARFGGAAALDITERPDTGGTRSCLTLPFHDARPVHQESR